MSEISESIQTKCLAFGDRVIKLNDYLLSQSAMEHEKYKKELRQRKPGQRKSSISLLLVFDRQYKKLTI